jgi:tetratricopeptide (TPR) repeat protein
MGQALKDPAAAQATLRAGNGRNVTFSFDDPAYQRFITQLIEVPKNGGRDLAILIDRNMNTSAVTRQVALAEALYGFGDYQATERLARGAVQAEPDYRDGWNVLASAQLTRRSFGDAERSLKISTDLDSSYGYSWYLRGKVAEASGKPNRAKEYFRRAELLGYKKR